MNMRMGKAAPRRTLKTTMEPVKSSDVFIPVNIGRARQKRFTCV